MDLVVQENVDSCDNGLIALLTEFSVSDQTIGALGEAGCTSVALYAALGDGLEKKEVRANLSAATGVDPTAGKSELMEMTRLVAAWGAASVRSEVVIRQAAEREANFLPVRIHKKELLQARANYERIESIELTDEIAPGQAYLERKIPELTSALEAEPLTMVTTMAHDDLHRGMTEVGADPVTGLFKLSRKTFGTVLPRDSEEFRNRIKTMGVMYGYLRGRAPNRRCLETATERNWSRYCDYFLGKEVWGMATRDLQNRPISTPSLEHVITYEYQFRRGVIQLMNSGVDFWSAFLQMKGDAKHYQIHFLHQVALRPCHSVTAPGMAGQAPAAGPGNRMKLTLLDAHGIEQRPRQLEIADDPRRDRKQARLNKVRRLEKQLENARGGAKASGKGAAKRQLAIEDQQEPPPRWQKGQGKGGKGKDKSRAPTFPPGAANETPKGLRICASYNRGSCTYANCKFVHVCWWCGKEHAGGDTRTCEAKE